MEVLFEGMPDSYEAFNSVCCEPVGSGCKDYSCRNNNDE